MSTTEMAPALEPTPIPMHAPAPSEWEHVHVTRLELERAAPSSTLASVRVCVALGHLLPVDVEAELTIEGGPDASLPDVVTERMWCAQSYQNDRFLFEAQVPDRRIAGARRITARIRPAGTAHDHPGIELTVPTVELDLAPHVDDGP